MDCDEDGQNFFCLDTSSKRSDIRVYNCDCIVTKIEGITVDIATGRVTVDNGIVNWAFVKEKWDAYFAWVEKHMPDALKA
jgi:hypothetical protein